jgi:hypothetical protein
LNVHRPHGDFPAVEAETVTLKHDGIQSVLPSRGRKLAKLAILLSVITLEGLWVVGLIWLVTKAVWTLPP